MSSRFSPCGLSGIIRTEATHLLSEHHHDGDFEQGVMVDVGPGAGGLVIYTGAALRGQEIEISPAGHDSKRGHTDVLRRETRGRTRFSGRFRSLAQGRTQGADAHTLGPL